MAEITNYTPGEYAKEHIRITPTTLADGRDFFYLDDDPEYVSGAKTRELKDPRPLDYRFAPHLDADGNEVPYAAPQMELQHTEAYHEKTGGNLLKDIMNAELEAEERVVMRNHSWVAYVPAAARWPLEVHVAPVRDVLTLDQLNDQERWDLASMYSHLLKRGNAFFDKGDGKGMDLPYIAAWHQAPIHDARRENYRLNLQFFSFRRAANKIKYLAGSESGMAAWISDTTPELIAKRFHELGQIDISD